MPEEDLGAHRLRVGPRAWTSKGLVAGAERLHADLIVTLEGGRWLTVLLSPVGEGAYYVVTARNATVSERREAQRNQQ